MPEVLRDLVVSLSLKTDNFSRNINSINRQSREAESAFRLAGAGIDNWLEAALQLRQYHSRYVQPPVYAADQSGTSA